MTKINLNDYPNVFKRNTKFWADFLNYMESCINGGKKMNLAKYNLIVSKRDVSLWTKSNVIPHRGWKVSQVKKYFGIKGSKKTLQENFTKMFDEYMSLEAEMKKKAMTGDVVHMDAW